MLPSLFLLQFPFLNTTSVAIFTSMQSTGILARLQVATFKWQPAFMGLHANDAPLPSVGMSGLLLEPLPRVSSVHALNWQHRSLHASVAAIGMLLEKDPMRFL